MIQFALYANVAFEVGDDFVDVGQTQSESFHVVAIARRYTIELIKYFFQVFPFDADTVVANRYFHLVADGAGTDKERQRYFLTAVFHRVVKQVENDVGKVHLVDRYDSVLGFEVGIDDTAIFLDFEFEGAHHAGYDVVHVDVVQLHEGLLSVEHRHLEHLLDLEPQPLGLVVDDARYVLEQRRTLGYRGVVEHLCRQRDGRDRGLELVGHVVDEIVFHLGELLLTEGYDDGKQEGDQQDEGEGKRGYHEFDRTRYVVPLRGEVDLQVVDTGRRIVGEDGLCEEIPLDFRVILVGTVQDFVVLVVDGKLEGEVEPIVLKLRFQIGFQFLDVDTLHYGPGTGFAEHVENHLVEQSLLIEVLSLAGLLHVAVGADERIVVFGSRCCRRDDGTGLFSERETGYGPVGRYDGELMMGGNVLLIVSLFIRREHLFLLLFQIFVQVALGFVEFEAGRYRIQAALDGLGKLLVSHLDHVLHIHDLYIEQPDKGECHDYGQ